MTQTKKKGAKPRQKGAAFERQIAGELFGELGISFKRDLDQYREKDRGDLIAQKDEFPFVIECKAYATGTQCYPEWIQQAKTAASAAGKLPAVIYKFNNRPVRVLIFSEAIAEASGGELPADLPVEMSVQSFCAVAREIMARRAGY